VMAQLRSAPDVNFRERVPELVIPYVLWMAFANTTAATLFLVFGRRVATPHLRQVLIRFALVLYTTAALTAVGYLVAADRWPASADLLTWGVSLLPVLPAVLFAWYVIRFQIVPFVLERTLVYGGIVVGLLLLHRLAVNEVAGRLADRYRIHVSIL